jgi:hypothetical protein
MDLSKKIATIGEMDLFESDVFLGDRVKKKYEIAIRALILTCCRSIYLEHAPGNSDVVEEVVTYVAEGGTAHWHLAGQSGTSRMIVRGEKLRQKLVTLLNESEAFGSHDFFEN